MDSIDKLSAIFRRFPGIGPRQAERFVQFLLRASPAIRRELVEAINGLSTSVHQCQTCFRFYSGNRGLCSICSDSDRDRNILIVIATDADLMALEHSGNYRGHYFVLGGTIDLASDKNNGLRIKQLIKRAFELKEHFNDFAEIVLAFPANPEGDATMTLIREELEPIAKEKMIRVTSLGRGLSTGSELEYADPETLKNALEARK